MKTVSSLDEKDDEESEEQKEEDRISYPCPPSKESNSPTHTLFNFPSCLPKDDCCDPVDSFEISLFYYACYACGQDANMHVLVAPTCNYYERGTISPPLYVSNTIELQETAYTMHWLYLVCMNCSFMTCRCIGRELDFVVA